MAYLGCFMWFVSKMTVSRLKSAIYEPHLMKNWEGYFLNSYSPIQWLVCVVNLLRAKISLLRVCTAQAMWLPFWLYIDIYINIITFILAFSNQIESFHKLHIKPNKLDSTTEKWILLQTLWFTIYSKFNPMVLPCDRMLFILFTK